MIVYARVSVISRVRWLFRTNQYMNITCCAVRIEIIRKHTHSTELSTAVYVVYTTGKR